MMSLKLIPVSCIIGMLIAQLWYAEPNATLPSSTFTSHSSFLSLGAILVINLLASLMIPMNLFANSSGPNFTSLINLSTLLMNNTGLTFSLKACLNTVSVWGMIPSTAHTTTTAPSTALIARVTSPPKSTWPGVSIKLIKYSSSWYSCTIDTFAASMVIPRACSCSSKSKNLWSPASSSEIIPAPAKRLSDKVVLPWSMCAQIPMFLIFSVWYINSLIFAIILSRLLKIITSKH